MYLILGPPNFRAKESRLVQYIMAMCVVTNNHLGVDFVLMCNKLKGKVIYEDK